MKLKQGMREKGSGIEYRFQIDGKRYSVSGKTVKEVQQKEIELRTRLAEGYSSHLKSCTVRQYFKLWIKRKELTCKGGTIVRYTQCMNKVMDICGDLKLSTINLSVLSDLQTTLRKDYSVSMTNSCIEIFRTMLSSAVKEDIIQKNPALLVQKLVDKKQKATETYHRALTVEEQKLFFAEMRKEWYYELFALMINTGMRVGEVYALTWADIGDKFISVNKQIARSKDNKRIVETPKSASSIRDIPLNDQIRNVLNSQKEKAEAYGLYKPKNTIFFSTRGHSLLAYAFVRPPIIKVLKRLEKNGTPIEPISSHAFRDTFATRFVEQGGNFKTLQKILGHSTLSMTMDLYAHVLDDTKINEMGRLKIEI